MAKRKSKGSNTVADQIATFIGKSMGGLANRKNALQRELAAVEKQIAGVRDSVMRQFSGVAADARKSAKRAVKAARKSSAVKSARKALSPETRAKMAASATKRWAAAKKAGKNALG